MPRSETEDKSSSIGIKGFLCRGHCAGPQSQPLGNHRPRNAEGDEPPASSAPFNALQARQIEFNFETPTLAWRMISSYRDRERGHSFDKADRCEHYRNHAKERWEGSDDYYDESVQLRKDADVDVAWQEC
jgi:hypothetical protein